MPRETRGDVSPAEESVGPVGRPLSPEVAPYWLKAVIDSADDAIITKTLEGVITSWNPGAQRLFGYTSDEVIGQPVTILFPPDHIDEEPAILARIRAGERIDHYETVRRRKDGTLLDISLTVSPIRKPDGTIIGASKIVRDITGRKREERDRQFLLELGEKIRLGGSKPGELLDDVTRAAGEHLGAARALFAEIDEARNRGTVMHEYRRDGLPPVPREYSISDYSPETLEEVRTGRAVVNHDAEHDPRTAAKFETAYEPFGERSYVSIPLFTDGRWRAIFWVSDDKARLWAPQEVALLESVAERAWLAAEKLRGEAEADRQRRLYDAILSSTPDLVYVFDLDHRFTYANDVLLRMWGRTWGEAIGKNCLELGYPDWHAAMHDRELEEVKATKRPVRGVVPFEGTFGRRLYDYIFVPIIGADGEVEAVAGTTRDVTELKEAEENLRQSREILGLAMSGSHMGAWSLDLATDEVYWSPELEAIFGLPAGSFSGHIEDYYDFVHPEDRERVRREVREAVEGHRGYVIEFRYLHADGGVRWMEGRGQAVYSAEGEPRQVFGIGLDITERKRAVLNAEFLADVGDDFARVSAPGEVVRAVGERLSRFLNVSTCAFVEVSEAAATATINYEWHREGVPDLKGVYSLPEFVTPEFLRTAKAGEAIVIRDVTSDSRIVDPGPWSELEIGAHINVPLIHKGEWRFSLCVYHTEAYDWRDDVVNLMRELAARVWTRLERAFAEREREELLRREHAARLQAEEAGRLKDEFLATVSHELRTPLTAILGWAHMLRSGQYTGESVARAYETIERNARAQSQLIEDLLDVSRIITGKLRVDVRPIDPNTFIESAVEAVRPAAEAKGVRLQKVLDTGLVTVSGDPVRLQQVVWNLLSNAIKFTPRGGRVQVKLERVNSHVELSVSDTGQGIPSEFLPHVFDRFRQADMKTTRHHGGLGLGLAIVRHLVELHGGSVRAESPGEGRGATFTVLLPVAPVYDSAAPEERVHPAARKTLPDYECPERLDGMRVLVVDDEADAREMLKAGLEGCGAVVEVAASAAEVLSAIREAPPDLLVSDIGMPDVDGYELIRRVRALPVGQGGNVPAIALTAYARTEDRLQALRAGYQMHVTKPVELTELAAVVASLVRRAG